MTPIMFTTHINNIAENNTINYTRLISGTAVKDYYTKENSNCMLIYIYRWLKQTVANETSTLLEW